MQVKHEFKPHHHAIKMLCLTMQTEKYCTDDNIRYMNSYYEYQRL